MQFARTGDPRYFYTADTAARHTSEVDTIHHVNDDLRTYFDENWPRPVYPPRAGMVHQHTVAHVSGYYPIETVRELFLARDLPVPERESKRMAEARRNPYLCMESHNLGHVWTEGLAGQFCLTGEPFLRETAERVAGSIARLVEDREYGFMESTHSGRVTGWSMLVLGAAHEISRDERYRSAMRTLAEDALARQDPVCGGWLYHPMAAGHCRCETASHTGIAGFIAAVLINGLSRYYFLSGDARVADAVKRGVTFLDNDTWREERRDWRYTSCPATPLTGQPGVVILAHANAVRIANNPEHLRILRIACGERFGRTEDPSSPGRAPGRALGFSLLGSAEALGVLALHSSGR